MEETYIPHAAVRLCKINSDQWRVSHLIDKKEYDVEALVAAVLTLFCGGETVHSFFNKAKNIINHFEENKLLSLIEYLKKKNILIEKNDPENQTYQQLIKKWCSYGWSEAADYYLSSISYPFVEGTVYDYNNNDIKRMSSYYTEEPDLNRSKEYENPIKIIKLPTTADALTSDFFQVDCSTALNSPNTITRNIVLNREHIEILFSVVFGVLRSRSMDMNGVADAIRKTSPSGGSRHPTEGYIIVNGEIDGLSGAYHFSVSKNALEQINSKVSHEELAYTYPGLFRNSITPKAIIVLSSLFERNMYRYREPRTFRSIFIDIGHISETIRLVSQALGFQFFSHTYIDFTKAELMLKIDPLEEGIFYSIGIK